MSPWFHLPGLAPFWGYQLFLTHGLGVEAPGLAKHPGLALGAVGLSLPFVPSVPGRGPGGFPGPAFGLLGWVVRKSVTRNRIILGKSAHVCLDTGIFCVKMSSFQQHVSLVNQDGCPNAWVSKRTCLLCLRVMVCSTNPLVCCFTRPNEWVSFTGEIRGSIAAEETRCAGARPAGRRQRSHQSEQPRRRTGRWVAGSMGRWVDGSMGR